MLRVAGSILSRGKVCLFEFFSFPITFGGQCGGGSLGACRGEASAALSLEPVRQL